MRSSARRIEARLVGTPCLVVDGTPRALERHDAALIALLAIEGPMTRARMATWLWPDTPQPQARSHLRQRLLRLRRTAGVDWLEADGTLRLADGCVDLHRVAALAADPGTALRGELLAGLDYSDVDGLDDWVRTARERWHRARLDVLSAEAAAHEEGHRLVAALACANRIIEEAPLQEVAHRRVMRLHYLRGDRAAALVAASICVETLERELGVAPDAETRRLIATIDGAVPIRRLVPSPDPLALRRPPRLVGRDAAWQDLERAVSSRKAVLVTGDAGIGKTRLIEDVCGAHAGRALVVAALAGDDRLPYATLVHVLRAGFERTGMPSIDWVRAELARFVPSLGAAPDAPFDHLRLHAALEAETSRWQAEGLAILAIDDLHFADAATLQLLPHWVSTTTARSVMSWVLTSRSSDLPCEIDAWATRAEPRALRHIGLGPLAGDDVEELLESIALEGLDAATAAKALIRQTGGNPFYVVQTLLAWLQAPDRRGNIFDGAVPTPASIQALVRRQVARLAPTPLQLARVLALAGQDFAEALAEETVDGPPEALDAAWGALERERILVDGRLAHDLLRQGVLESMQTSTVRKLSGRIAQALECRGGVPPVRIADHWAAAGRLDRAAPHWFDAAKHADEAQRFVEAVRLFQAAADAYAAVGRSRQQHAALQELVAPALRRHDLGTASKVAEQLTALASDDDSRAWALERQCEIAIFGRRDAVAEQLARGAVALGQRSGNGWVEFNAGKKLAIVLAYRGRHDEALAILAAQRGWAEDHASDRNAIVWRSDFAAVLEIADRHAEASAAFDEAHAAAVAASAWSLVYAVKRNRALQCHATGDLVGALAAWHEALLQTERLGEAFTTRNPRDAVRRAAVWRDAGRHAEALGWLEESRSTLANGDSPFWADLCADQLALSWLELGEPARASALCMPEPTSGHVEAKASRTLVRARLARLRNQAMTVQSEFDAHCPRRLALLLRLDASRQSVNLDMALAAQLEIAGEASAHGLCGIALHAHALAAFSASRAGRPGDAEALVGTVIERVLSVHPTGMTRVELLALAIDVLRRIGRTERSERLAAMRERELRGCADHVPAAYRRGFLDRHALEAGLRHREAVRR